jgi:hypothetical protein
MTRITILKGLAICSSILLAGGFVAYRQKQAASPENGEVEMMPSSKSRQVVFPSSKNIDAVLSNPNQADSSGTQVIPADPEEKEKVLLPSSKHIEMPIFKRSAKPAEDQPPEKKVDPTLLPNSKGLTPGMGPGGNDMPINRDTIERLLGERKKPEDEKSKEAVPEEEP